MERKKCEVHKFAMHYRVVGDRPAGVLTAQQRKEKGRQIEWHCPKCEAEKK